MSQLNSEEVTNLYLYGSKTTPSNLVDEALIRPDDEVIIEALDGATYMNSGAGRFATVAHSTLVQSFFENELISIDEGIYTQVQMANILNIDLGIHENGTPKTYSGFSINQESYQDSFDDYIERVYIHHATSFRLNPEMRFVVGEGGGLSLTNVVVRPFNDNFDFVGGDGDDYPLAANDNYRLNSWRKCA